MKKRDFTRITVRFSAFLMCVLMLLSCLVAVNAEEADTTSKGSRIMVSLGDSYASGEGIEPFYAQSRSTSKKVQNEDWLAHRSENSWPGQLKLDGKLMSKQKDTKWFFVASSGAVTANMKGKQTKEYDIDKITGSKDLDPQLDIFKKLGDKKAEYVTVSIGGNDAQFSDVVSTAALNFFDKGSLSVKLSEVWNEFYNGTSKTDSIRDRLYQAYHDIADAAGPQAKIIVVGYPRLLNENGGGIIFNKEDAALINDSVSRFNKEIESIVNACKADGMKICFVSVEEAFKGHGAYAKDEYINPVYLTRRAQDLVGGNSSYSIHPNKEGAKVYAECVQAKIDSIESDGGVSEWPFLERSDEREVVLVLDTSGSMSGDPIAETRTAAEEFVDTVLSEDASVGIVTYDSSSMRVADFSSSETLLKNAIGAINPGGNTNMDAGLTEAYSMLSESNAKKRIIVLMSDGEPNDGRVGNDLIAFADEIKNDGIYIYTLGFFRNLGGNKGNAQALLEAIASAGCHYEVDNADDLKFFFGDVADQINGQKYFYVRIACPVDVTVTYGDEVLSSKADELVTRTEFGTLTFEDDDSGEEYGEGVDSRVKILRLKADEKYDIKIEATARGHMDYTLSLMDENGDYTDTRTFKKIKLTKRTEITTVAEDAKKTVLRVDEDGDGKTDITYAAKSGEIGEEVKGIPVTTVIIIAASLACVLIIVVFVAVIVKKHKKAAQR